MSIWWTTKRRIRKRAKPIPILFVILILVLLYKLVTLWYQNGQAAGFGRYASDPKALSFFERHGIYENTIEHSFVDEDGLSAMLGDHSGDLTENIKRERVPQILPNGQKLKKVKSHKSTTEQMKKIVKMSRYFQKLMSLIIHDEPKIGFEMVDGTNKDGYDGKIIPREYGGNGIIDIAMQTFDDGGSPILSESYLADSLKVPLDLVAELTKSHDHFVSHMPKSYPEDFYEGEGIIMIGGGKFSWLSLLSLENLRKVGSKLPVEIMIPTQGEYEHQLCNEILPNLNAKCILLYDYFPNFQRKTKRSISGYQLKSLALLVSSFEKVLFLDSDNMSVSNPDSLFSCAPFLSRGMVMWPDFWRRVTNPYIYSITRKTIGDRRIRYGSDDVSNPENYNDYNFRDSVYSDYPLHDRKGTIPDGTTESGQMLIDKRTHYQVILLSIYYNFYGPRHYYPLLSQGGKGEGDKETFLLACNSLDYQFYQVKKLVNVIGYWVKTPYEQTYNGVGMIQYDPSVDYENLHKFATESMEREDELFELKKTFLGRLKIWFMGLDEYNEGIFRDYFTKANSKPLFIHSNFPKLDPVLLKEENRLHLDGDINNRKVRMYEDQSGLDFDYELRQWIFIRKWFCKFESSETGKRGIDLNYLRLARVNSIDYCPFIESELEFLMSTTEAVTLGPVKKETSSTSVAEAEIPQDPEVLRLAQEMKKAKAKANARAKMVADREAISKEGGAEARAVKKEKAKARARVNHPVRHGH